MIQRIQSIFLLLTAILMAVTIFSPLALLDITDGNNGILTFFPCGIYSSDSVINNTWGVIFWTILGAGLPFASIFLYKNRKLQIKLGIATSIIIILFYITAYIYYYFVMQQNSLSFVSIQYGTILPIIAIIFNILAISKIKKDEKLVQSLNRIR